MNDAAIELRGIAKSYGKKQVLTGLDLSVPKGSVLGLLGTNGAGKTTLIKCALGLIRPQAGTAQLLGEDSWRFSAAAKQRIGYVPQVINLYPWMKVRHLVEYTAAFYSNWNHELVARLMEQWSIPAEDRVGPLSWASSKDWRSCWRWVTSRSYFYWMNRRRVSIRWRGGSSCR